MFGFGDGLFNATVELMAPKAHGRSVECRAHDAQEAVAVRNLR